MAGYGSPFASPYFNPPPPPAPMPDRERYEQYAPSPNIQYAEPGSPIVYPVSPVGSPPRSRDSSRHRNSFGEPFIGVPDDRGRERMYIGSGHLVVGGGSQALSRSASERSRPRRNPDYVEVAKSGTRGRHGRSPSVATGYYYEGGKKHARDAQGSTYSNSSYGSRSHSKARHSRSPSCDSCDSWENEERAMAPYKRDEELELVAKLQKMEMQLEQVNKDISEKKKAEEQNKNEKARNAEIERRVNEELRKAKEIEEARRKEEAARAAAEKARIKEEAEKILREQEAERKRKEQEEAARKEELRLGVQQEMMRMQAQQPAARRTYTKFSKVHLCKEALDERNIGYTEESEHFLVHRVVDKNEQNYLWSRTKEIRTYYRQIQEAADLAPTVRTTEGTYVKYVQIAGQPQPIALPVTFTQTPGGGQTQRVDPIKIKWSDIFKPSRF